MLVPRRRWTRPRRSPRASPKRPRSAIRTAKAPPSARWCQQTQWDKIQRLIETGIAEGATLVTGGPDRPEGLDKGFYVKPTVFADVTNDMTIAREEIFGPVLVIIGYKDDDDAVRIANDTHYGLAGYVSARQPSSMPARSRRKLRAGNVNCRAAATAPRRSAATSSPATAASGASSASRSTSRSRPSLASTRRRLQRSLRANAKQFRG